MLHPAFTYRSAVVPAFDLLSGPAPRYPVRWAFEPADVPQFDVSRGGDPFWSLDAEAFELEEIRQWLVKRPDFTAEYRMDPYADTILGGDKAAPPITQTSVYITSGTKQNWDLGFHGTTEYYPRLVRQTYEYVGRPEQPSKKVSKAVAGLYADSNDELIFRRKVVEVAHGYSLMHSKLQMSGTLKAWRVFSREMHFCLRLLKLITEIREAKPTHYKSAFLETLKERFGDENEERPTEAPAQFSLLGWQLSRGLDASPKELMERMGHYLWGNFELEASDKIQLTWTPGEFVVRCGARGWAYKELHDAFRDKHVLRECPRCHKLFFAKNPKNRWCGDNCKRMGSYYSRKERELESS